MRTEINTKIDTVKNTLESKLDAVTTDIQALRTECAVKFKDHDAALDALDGRIGDVATSVGNLANRDELIISGIPFLQGEDLLKHFKAICKQLGLDERLSSMVDVKRLKAAAQKLKAAAIRLKKAGKLFTVYTKLGVAYVRRVAGADPIVIVSEEQLNQLS
ncbi:hypothetical protein quinque_010865 [Culex quinquefasciatus]